MFRDVPPAVVVVIVILILAALSGVAHLIGALGVRLQERALAGGGAGNTPTPPAPTPPAPPAPSQQQSASAAAYAPLVAQAAAQRTDLHTLPAARRQHTLIAAKPGDGKTQTLNTFLCADLRAGHQAIVLNPQFTHYHPDDQPLDLRPIRDRFEVVRDEAVMPGLLLAIYREGKRREPLYTDGQPVGHHISVIIDEWPRIVESDYGPACVEMVRKIVREMRKCNIWITVAAQDAQVETLGFKSGVRASFMTKLCGNVDNATWRALIGPGTPQTPVKLGTWMTERGLAHVLRPTAQDIHELVALPVGPDTYAVLTPDAATAVDATPRPPALTETIAAWLDAQPSIAGLSINDVCRGVGRDTGGDSWQAVRAALQALADDGHDGAAALLAARAKVRG